MNIQLKWFLMKLFSNFSIIFDHRIPCFYCFHPQFLLNFIAIYSPTPFTVRRQGRPWTPRTPLVQRKVLLYDQGKCKSTNRLFIPAHVLSTWLKCFTSLLVSSSDSSILLFFHIRMWILLTLSIFYFAECLFRATRSIPLFFREQYRASPWIDT